MCICVFLGIKETVCFCCFLLKMTCNDWETPRQAFQLLAKHLPEDAVIYDHFRGEFNRSQIYLQDLGYSVVTSPECEDRTENGTCSCMNVQIPKEVTCLVTNPPYTEIESTVEMFQESGLMWAMLIPLAVLRKTWFNVAVPSYKVLKPRGRYHYIQGGKVHPRCPFESVWVLKGIDNIEQYKYEREKREREEEEEQLDLFIKKLKS